MWLLGDYHNQILGIYKEYHRLIISVALHIYRDSFYAQDVLQDTMLKISHRSILNRLSCMNNSQHIRNYIIKIARSRAIDRYQSLIADKEIISLEQYCDASDMADKNLICRDFQTDIEMQERIKLIVECINSLPDIYRQIIRSKVFAGMNTQGIALLYGITEATVRKRLQRARELLKDRLIEVRIIDSGVKEKLGY